MLLLILLCTTGTYPAKGTLNFWLLSARKFLIMCNILPNVDTPIWLLTLITIVANTINTKHRACTYLFYLTHAIK
jgi:hypothetical protein